MQSLIDIEIFPINNTEEQISVVADTLELYRYGHELELKIAATNDEATYTHLQLLALVDRELQVHIDGLDQAVNEKIWWIINVETSTITPRHSITLQDTDPAPTQTVTYARACTCTQS